MRTHQTEKVVHAVSTKTTHTKNLTVEFIRKTSHTEQSKKDSRGNNNDNST
jgi:hypothetical protein